MKTLFGITLERFKKGVGEEALIKHSNEFKTDNKFDADFFEYDSLYDRRLNELKYVLYLKYTNTLSDEINNQNKFKGIKRIISIGNLENIKDFEETVEGNNFLNRPKITEEDNAVKRYRIYREKGDTIKNVIKDIWNKTVKKFCEKWLEEFDEKTLQENEFYSLLVNLKNLNGFEMEDYEKFRSLEISKIKNSFLKFLSDYNNEELNLREIFLNYFKDKKDYSIISLNQVCDNLNYKLFLNLKDIFKNKFNMNETDVKNKILKNDIFFNDYINIENNNLQDNFKDSLNSIIREKISKWLLEEKNYFSLLIGDDIYILNKKTCILPLIYKKGDEDYLRIEFSYKLRNDDETHNFFNEPFSNDFESKDLLKDLRIDEDGGIYLNNFSILSEVESMELKFIYVNSVDLNKKGKVSFLNLPQNDDEYFVDENNFLEVVRNLNRNFRYKIEEI